MPLGITRIIEKKTLKRNKCSIMCQSTMYTICFLCVTLFFFALQIYAVQLAWNNSMPQVFKLPDITFLGAFCLLFLAQSFFTSTIQNISNITQNSSSREFSSEV